MLVDPTRPPLDLGRRWTYADLQELPEGRYRYEIVDGELLVSPAPRTRHQIVLGNLHELFRNQLQRAGVARVLFAPTDVRLADDVVLEPDLLAVSAERAAIIGELAIEGAPELVVEILSAGTAHRDRGRKRERYGTHGVREYWIVDTEAQTVEVHVATPAGEMPCVASFGAGEVVRSAVFADLACPVDEIVAP